MSSHDVNFIPKQLQVSIFHICTYVCCKSLFSLLQMYICFLVREKSMGKGVMWLPLWTIAYREVQTVLITNTTSASCISKWNSVAISADFRFFQYVNKEKGSTCNLCFAWRAFQKYLHVYFYLPIPLGRCIRVLCSLIYFNTLQLANNYIGQTAKRYRCYMTTHKRLLHITHDIGIYE